MLTRDGSGLFASRAPSLASLTLPLPFYLADVTKERTAQAFLRVSELGLRQYENRIRQVRVEVLCRVLLVLWRRSGGGGVFFSTRAACSFLCVFYD